jgi:hypothetical protein
MMKKNCVYPDCEEVGEWEIYLKAFDKSKYLCDQHYRIYADRIYEQMKILWQKQIEVLKEIGVRI